MAIDFTGKMRITFTILIFLVWGQVHCSGIGFTERSVSSQSQTQEYRWETIIFSDDVWRYFPGVTQPDPQWHLADFDDSAWPSGQGGIGYGDDDDQTVISSTISVFLRKEFPITDIQQIGNLLLHADYDDAFVAYLNGVEIARANVEGNPPSHNQLASGNHEAEMYSGGNPSPILIGSELLIDGNNVLALQVHNVESNSSDLSSNFFLSAEVSSSEQLFRPVPDWFFAPEPFVSSNLPILNITTDNGLQIPDEPKIRATMGIIYNGPGQTNYLTDPSNHYDGYIGIERRGNSSQSFPKKPYNIETRDSLGNNRNVSLFGMPEENDWVLRASYMDHTFVRNPLAMHMSRQTGRWASRCQQIELVLNGEYQGIYTFMEKIKRDNGRLDIARLEAYEIEEPDVSGGYIYEITGFETNLDQSRNLKYPKFEDAPPQQINYIVGYDNAFRNSMASQNFKDKTTGYHAWIDVESFVAELIVQEAMRNSDAYGWSGYFHKDQGGKINAGPVWDFDQSAGNSSYPDNGVVGGWLFAHNGTSNTPFFWEKLFTDPSFSYQVKLRWEDLRKGAFQTDLLLAFVDSIALLLSDAQAREFELWPVLGKDIWRETTGYWERNTYQKEVDYLKSFLTERWAWMDTELAKISTPVSAVSLNQQSPTNEVFVFPNPAREFLIFDLKTETEIIAEIRIYNSSGMLVQNSPSVLFSPDKGRYTLEFEGVNTSGMFYYQISAGNKALYSGRFVRLP